MYLVGSFNNWGDYPESQLSMYKLNKVNNSSAYTCSISIDENSFDKPNEYIKLKINSGYGNYSPNDYTIIEDNGVYKLSPQGSSFHLYGYSAGSTLTVTVDVSTGIVTFS